MRKYNVTLVISEESLITRSFARPSSGLLVATPTKKFHSLDYVYHNASLCELLVRG